MIRRSAVGGPRSSVAGQDRGMALVVVVLVSVAVGILLAVVGMLFHVSRRAQARLQGGVREVRCQAEAAALGLPPWEAAGRPVLEDPAFLWTAPPGRGEALDVGDGRRLRYVTAGDEAFVYLEVSGEARCVGDRVTP